MTMKNRSLWTLVLLGALCLCLAAGVYFFGGVTEDLTDAISYRQTGNAGKITNDNFVSQSFLCAHDHVKGLLLRVSTLGNTYENAQAVLTLKDDQGAVLVTQKIPLKGVKDKSAFQLDFDRLSGTKNKVLTLVAEAEGLEGEQVYSLMMGQGSVGGLLTTADGKTSENNSLFMTLNFENHVRPMRMVYLFLIAAFTALGLAPLAVSGKGGRENEK